MSSQTRTQEGKLISKDVNPSSAKEFKPIDKLDKDGIKLYGERPIIKPGLYTPEKKMNRIVFSIVLTYLIREETNMKVFIGEKYNKENEENKREEYYLVKEYNRRYIEDNKLESFLNTQVSIQNQHQNKGQLRVIDYFKTVDYYYLILEWPRYGNLKNYVRQNGLLLFNVDPTNRKEKILKLREFFFKIVRATQKLVNKLVFYRHQGLEDIYLDGNLNIKFDTVGLLELKMLKKEDMKRPNIYVNYLLEELDGYKRELHSKIYIWILGVLYYSLLTSYEPFKGNDLKSLVDDIKERIKSKAHLKLLMNDPDLKHDAKLIDQMLQIDFVNMIPLDDIILDPIFDQFRNKVYLVDDDEVNIENTLNKDVEEEDTKDNEPVYAILRKNAHKYPRRPRKQLKKRRLLIRKVSDTENLYILMRKPTKQEMFKRKGSKDMLSGNDSFFEENEPFESITGLLRELKLDKPPGLKPPIEDSNKNNTKDDELIEDEQTSISSIIMHTYEHLHALQKTGGIIPSKTLLNYLDKVITNIEALKELFKENNKGTEEIDLNEHNKDISNKIFLKKKRQKSLSIIEEESDSTDLKQSFLQLIDMIEEQKREQRGRRVEMILNKIQTIKEHLM